MTETKSKKVTFDDSLPRGTCATFTHEGARWIAYPDAKVTALSAVLDTMLGALEFVRDDLVRQINNRPEDAAQLSAIVARTNRAEALAREKARAWTI